MLTERDDADILSIRGRNERPVANPCGSAGSDVNQNLRFTKSKPSNKPVVHLCMLYSSDRSSRSLQMQPTQRLIPYWKSRVHPARVVSAVSLHNFLFWLHHKAPFARPPRPVHVLNADEALVPVTTGASVSGTPAKSAPGDIIALSCECDAGYTP